MKKGSGEFDLIVIGAGGVGMASGMYAARLGLKTLVLGSSHGSELPIGGVITTTNVVENYPGFISLSGTELAKKLEEHARSYDLVTIKEERAEEISKNGKKFKIKTTDRNYSAKTLIFATGTKWRKLDVPGSKAFENRGVNYCALCDGPLYAERTVAVVGGSDSAANDALILAQNAKKVYIIYRGEEIHPEQTNLEKVKKNKKIEIINKTNIKEILGNDFVESVILDRKYRGKNEISLDGVFVAIGHEVLSGLAKGLGVRVNKKKEIVIDHKTAETNVKGVFAAGDVTDKDFKQLITGVADGCTAAYSAYEYLGGEVLI